MQSSAAELMEWAASLNDADTESCGHIHDRTRQRTIVLGKQFVEPLEELQSRRMPHIRFSHLPAPAADLSAADKVEVVRDALGLANGPLPSIVAAAILKMGQDAAYLAHRSQEDKISGLYSLVCGFTTRADPLFHVGSRALARWASFAQRLLRNQKLEHRNKALGIGLQLGQLLSGMGIAQSEGIFVPGGGSLGGTPAPRLYGTSTHKVPRRRDVVVSPEQHAAWRAVGGIDVELALADDAIAVLDARWLIRQAARGEPLPCRQQIPYDAFLTVGELQASCRLHDEAHGLPLIVVSAVWLHPAHCDPKGHTLCELAVLLRAFLAGHNDPVNKGTGRLEAAAHAYAGKGRACCREKRWGVVWDWGSLHQHPDAAKRVWRTREETALFETGRASMGDLYAHPHVWVLCQTALPRDYPSGYPIPYDFPTVPWNRRGWPLLEQSLFSLVKDWRRVLNMSALARHAVDAAIGSTLGSPLSSTAGPTWSAAAVAQRVEAGKTDRAAAEEAARLVSNQSKAAQAKAERHEARQRAAEQAEEDRRESMSQSISLPTLSRWKSTTRPMMRGRGCRPSTDDSSPLGAPALSLAEVIALCTSPLYRIAPLCPRSFAKELALRSLANEAEDEPLVNRLYEAQFKRVMSGTTLLNFSGLGWTDAEAETVAETLRTGTLERLEWLLLHHNQIGTRGAVAVIRALEHCDAIRFVRLDDNKIHDTDKIATLALSSVHLGKLGLRLELGDNLPVVPFPWVTNSSPLTLRLAADEDDNSSPLTLQLAADEDDKFSHVVRKDPRRRRAASRRSGCGRSETTATSPSVASTFSSNASLSPSPLSSPLSSLSRSRAMTSAGTRSSPGCDWTWNDEEPSVLSPQHTRAWKHENVGARRQNGESVPEHETSICRSQGRHGITSMDVRHDGAESPGARPSTESRAWKHDTTERVYRQAS